MPAMSADSGWPWPDIRWHEPHAMAIPVSPLTDRGAAGCSSGNQSGGVAFPAIVAGVALPRAAGGFFYALPPPGGRRCIVGGVVCAVGEACGGGERCPRGVVPPGG